VTECSVPCNDLQPALPGRWRRDFSTALVLGLVAFLVYNANLRLISSGDNYPARYLPFGILGHGTVLLDPIDTITAQGEAHPYWIVNKYGYAFSRYPITVPVLVTPLYVPAVAYLHWRGWTEDRLERVARVMEKLTSALLASLSVGFMYLLLARRERCPWALWLTVAYGFGTNTWMISGQALWQHGLAELLLVVALFILRGPCTAQRSFGVGMLLALSACARPPDALFAAALGLYGLWWAKGKARFLVMGAAIPLVLLLTYNLGVTHHPAGAYAKQGKLSFFRHSLIGGVLGLLFSPARGLFVFSPFLLLLPWCLRATLREPRARSLALLILGGVIAQVLLYAKLDWRAGCSWGPRWLTDMLPLLVWMLAAGLGSLGPIGRTVLVLSTCVSIGVQAVGAFWYTGASDAVILKETGDPSRMPIVWDIWNTPFVAELRHGLAPRELTLRVDGFVDQVKADGQDVDLVVAGTDLEITGWALTDRHSPTAVRVVLEPIQKTKWRGPGHYPITETTALFERPDVTRTKQGNGPAGWQVLLKTDGLDPGPHQLEVKAQGSPGGEFRHVAHRPLLVLAAPSSAPGTAVKLERLSDLARDILRSRQNAHGYWLTAHTHSTQLDHPVFEMNVFTTALLVDILAPVARECGLEENLERARHHLRGQIEANGLVRYHGRPDSPTIPSLGCVITPDADDTALAWRIAGCAGDARLAAARKVLESYQTPEGLYRTWLAPRKEYISVAPGRDPNPTDVGIQMHVLLWLAQVDPPAARSLHRALQSAIGDDRLWVYYQQAPLVPLYREADLSNRGYPLCIPPERRQTAVAGQRVWVTVCEQLARCETKAEPRPSPEEIRMLLELLGKNSFAAVRSNPPLLYHNDLTARPSRYYWSADVGYALWLRLYLERTRSSDISRLKP
jgi:hypothetical protein